MSSDRARAVSVRHEESGAEVLATTFDTAAYLARIGYSGPKAATIETLRELHRAHLLAVPFENLDIHAGREIVLDEARLIEKIVGERRGGFCYEVNAAFAALLRGLGFAVTLLSAGVRRDDGSFAPEFDHMLLRVDLDEPWLADVSTFFEPLRLVDDVQHDGRDTYRLDREGGQITLMRLDHGDEWSARFRFTLVPWELSNYAGMCHYHQTSPDSDFTRNRICTRLTPNGRVSVTNGRLIVTADGERHETPLADDAAFAEALRQHFGIVMPLHVTI
ncbi:MAG: arylamine N-acetyltransferase [Chloroflexota bacterium]|nr:arylamine N-acetyltransferase [Chloroflexota bacterium]